ncbi:hypothetical protein J6590_003217 [Homalodisca vitripennis]|nr:hypothetical protein J6590_003217 [Homalodisca vitripennis]
MHYYTSNKMMALRGEILGNSNGQLTELDKMKLNNMYCGGPTFCQRYPQQCAVFLQAQRQCSFNVSNP